MIPAPQLLFLWNAAMGLFGVIFWLYGFLTLFVPAIFAPYGFILGILAGVLMLFFFLTEAVAGDDNVARAWDEGTEHDSQRAYAFGFNVAWIVYFVFWFLLAQEWIPEEAAFPAMGAFTGGSYCLFMGITGLRHWYETHNTPD